MNANVNSRDRAINARRDRARYFTAALRALLFGLVVGGGVGLVKPTSAIAQVAPPPAAARCPASVGLDLTEVARMHQLHVPKRDALQATNDLIRRCPRSAAVWFGAAKVHAAYGLLREARVDLNQAHALDPSGSFAPKNEIARIQRKTLTSKVENVYLFTGLVVLFIVVLGAVLPGERSDAGGTGRRDGGRG